MKMKVFSIIFTGIVFFLATDCKKEETIKLLFLSTAPVIEITTTTATSGGTLAFIGKAEIFTNGVCWNTTGNPSTSDFKTDDVIGHPQFLSGLSGLIAGTTYYVRAYATNSAGTAYGDELTFTTLCGAPTAATQDTLGVNTATTELSAVRPTLTTNPVSAITEASAISGGNITDDGGAPITDRGVSIYSVSLIKNSYGGKPGYMPRRQLLRTIHNGTGTGSFISNLTGLKPSTSYHVRSFAENSAGLAYGNYISFTTLPSTPSPPSATTQPATNISTTGATLNGTVNAYLSSTTVTFEYGTSTSYGQEVTAGQSPVKGNVNNVSGTITGLIAGTNYHFRVKAVNSLGISYGSDMEFTIQVPAVTTLAATNVEPATATLNGSVNTFNLTTIVTFEYGTTTSYGQEITAVQSPVTGNTNSNVSATLTGLTVGTYHFRIKAVNSLGTVYGSDFEFTICDQVPIVMTLGATNISATGATLNGTVNANGSPTTVTFEYKVFVYRQSKGGLKGVPAWRKVTATQSPVTGTTITNVSVHVTGLRPGTHLFNIKAENSCGTVSGASISFTTY